MTLLDSIHLYRHIIKSDKRVIDDFNKQSLNEFHNCKLYNWWADGAYLWFAQRYSSFLEAQNQRISFCSVFGEREVLGHINGIKVFFSGENIHNHPYDMYSDYLLQDKSTNLALGFEYFENERYMRFPLWILYMFSPTSTRDDIYDRCKELRFPRLFPKRHFCSMVASHDLNGLRYEMYDRLGSIAHISCAGRLLHNDDRLKNEFNDDKNTYIKEFAFNICPENSNSYGYVTEKIFQAIAAGCIPIYWGSYNNPEPQIINHDAVIFWDRESDNNDVIKTIERLYSSPKELDEFLHIPRLQDGAEEIIWELLNGLDKRISSLLLSK